MENAPVPHYVPWGNCVEIALRRNASGKGMGLGYITCGSKGYIGPLKLFVNASKLVLFVGDSSINFLSISDK